ncbi:MAG: hypothetical protein QOD07_1413 [Frankiaceae bacterium]|nr:hypothetical protein [Frankiaceae bacterium]
MSSPHQPGVEAAGPRSFAMPPLFADADAASVAGQRSFLRATRARLALAVGAAVLVAFGNAWVHDGVEILTALAAAAFVAALGAEVWLLADRPENRWYDGRAFAESAKTLAWRFAVGGSPFPVGLGDAADAFAEHLAQLLEDVSEVTILTGVGTPVTEEMAALRASPLAVRKASYLAGRIADQQQWYAGKARRNAKSAERWRLALIVIEVAGAAAALAKAFDLTGTDLTSVASAAVSAGAAWLAVKQHEAVARAYTFAAVELGIAAQRVRAVHDEERWALEVADAEEAISREHTMWRAARTILEPARARRAGPTDDEASRQP